MKTFTKCMLMITISFFAIHTVHGQERNQNVSLSNSSDSAILMRLYGSTDKNNVTYTRPIQEGEREFSAKDSITFRIAFSNTIHLAHQDYLFVITEAPNSYQQGCAFGYRNFYFFSEKTTGLVLIDSIVQEGEMPLGDVSEFNMVDIGKDKKALVTTFQNSHGYFTNTKSLFYVTLGKLTPLLSVNIEYNNADWKIPETENNKCTAEKSSGTFEIIQDEKDWYDIKVTETEYGFTKGCQETYVKKVTAFIYRYNGQEYIEKKDQVEKL